MRRHSKAALRRIEAERRREPGKFVPLPCVVLKSEAFTRLSAHSVKLLFDLLSQSNGIDRNGDMSATWAIMQHRGWRSRDTLRRALKELEETDFIERVRQGGRNRCTLYAVTFLAIDYCNGKLEVQPTTKPRSSWHKGGKFLQPPVALRGAGRKLARPIDTAYVSATTPIGTVAVQPSADQNVNGTVSVSVRPDSLFALTRRACTF